MSEQNEVVSGQSESNAQIEENNTIPDFAAPEVEVKTETPSENKEIENNKEPVVSPKKERTYTDADVDRIVKEKKSDGYRKGYETARKELLKQSTDQQGQSDQQIQEQYSEDFKRGYQTAQTQRQKEADTHVANEFVNRLKVEPDTRAADDVLSTVAEFEHAQLPLIHQLVSVPNTADVFNYLKENPSVRQEIKNLIQLDMVVYQQGGRSTMSHNKIIEISERLKQNASASKVKANNPRPPSGNDLKPSIITLGEKSTPKVSDLMKSMSKKSRDL